MISRLPIYFLFSVFILSGNSLFCQKKQTAPKQEAIQKKDSLVAKVKGCQFKAIKYKTGTTEKEGCMLKNKKQGAWREYDAEGHLQYIYTYAKGLLEGPFVSYYASGKIRSTGTYKRSCIVGLFVTYNEDGSKMSESTWVLEPNGGSSMKEQRFFNDKVKPDGTRETLDGKDYIWIQGARAPLN